MDLVDSTDAEIEKLSNELLKSAMKRMDPLLQQTAAMKAEVLEDMARASSEECLLIEKERNFLLAQTASLSDAGEDSNAVGEKEDLPSTEELRARMQSSLDEAMFQLRNQSKERLAALQTQVHEASTSLQEQLRSVSAELADQLDKLHEETAAAASGTRDGGAPRSESDVMQALSELAAAACAPVMLHRQDLEALDAKVLGHLSVDIGVMYNKALLVPEAFG